MVVKSIKQILDFFIILLVFIFFLSCLFHIFNTCFAIYFPISNTTNKGAAITAVDTFCWMPKLRYAGHVERMPDYWIPQMIMHGELDLGQRNLADLLKVSSNPSKMIWSSLIFGSNTSALVTCSKTWSWTEMNGESWSTRKHNTFN